LSNSARSDEEEVDDVPPLAELGLEDEEDEGVDDGVLLCDVDGEALESLELFDASAA
jgi:hypothetical protein